MKKIKTKKGKYILVDDTDFINLSKHKWSFSGKASHPTRKEKNKTIYMHREIMGFIPKGMVVDHIDRNPLNNQRKNLRLCSLTENNRNRCKNKNKCSSKYKGVHFFKRTGKWQSYIGDGKNRLALGYFLKESDAALAYNTAAQKIFGRFALLNKF